MLFMIILIMLKKAYHTISFILWAEITNQIMFLQAV